MRLLCVGVFCLILSACWQQDEVISVEKDGTMKWLVIASPDWELSSVDGVKGDLQSYTSQMQKAGWTVKKQSAVAKKKDVVVGLSGNLHKVAKKTDFYQIHAINQSVVKIEFLCPTVDDYRVNRTIKVKDSNRAPIRCDKGVQTFRF